MLRRRFKHNLSKPYPLYLPPPGLERADRVRLFYTGRLTLEFWRCQSPPLITKAILALRAGAHWVMETKAYWAAENFVDECLRELELKGAKVLWQNERLIYASHAPQSLAWANNTWLTPKKISITSISDGARQLRELGGRWTLASVAHHRRAQLIQEKLPRFKEHEVEFLAPLPKVRAGSWALIDADTILASPECTSPFPNGEIHFKEDSAPPSRAYLKLWEFFTLCRQYPKTGDTCLDLGASPGGWTWVLAKQLGTNVLSVDKAPLESRVARLPNVQSIKRDAFSLQPNDIEPIDWLFSDVICDPNRLYELVQLWLKSERVKNFVCTLKFKGATDFTAIEKFAAIQGSKLQHLSVNKHELTWWKVSPAK